ncbi:MAG: alpha/beta hydrolase [Gammaproteobacteria bacterium]|nr:alpha/beta hydrolase [Gammaproteobacteria bacterium]
MLIRSISYAFILLISTTATAQPVQLKNNNLMMNAEYLEGSNNQNPVIILHGLLQTHQFTTVNRLATALNEAGYTVLSPTLSLGINNRKTSLSCEAVHTHSMDSDSDELKLWINWLKAKSGKDINLIGHSAGGTTVLNYLESYNTNLINKVILISLSYYATGPTANETSQHEEMAKQHIQENSKKIHTYALNYCRSYPSYAKNFLSYYQWNTEKVTQAVDSFRDKITIIIGTGDKRVDSNWRKHLKNKFDNVISIEGANHFFDQSHEFELTDVIEGLLEQ